MEIKGPNSHAGTELAKQDLLVSVPTAKFPNGWTSSSAQEWNRVLALPDPRAGRSPGEWELRWKNPTPTPPPRQPFL